MGCGPTRGAARPVVGGHWDPRAGSSCLASAKMLAPLGGRTVGAPGAQDAVRSGCPLWTRCPAGAWGLSSAAVVPDRGRGARLTIRTKDHRECIVLSSAGRLAPTYGLLRACAGQHPSKPAQPLGPMLYRRQQLQCLHRRARKPTDYYNALLRTGKVGVLQMGFARKPAPLAGLRNALVHEHVDVDWGEVYNGLQRLEDLERFAQSVRRWLSVDRLSIRASSSEEPS